MDTASTDEHLSVPIFTPYCVTKFQVFGLNVLGLLGLTTVTTTWALVH